ncbi:hypothetical protein ACMFMF_001890 [Clarireedia jacksonii]
MAIQSNPEQEIIQHLIPPNKSRHTDTHTDTHKTKMKFPTATALLLTLLTPLASAATTAKFSLLSKSAYTPYNNVHFGGVAYVGGTLVGGLQPLQTLPVGGTITNGVLSFIGMDPSDDAIPAYFIHGAAGSWVALDVWASPQSGYSLDSKGNLLVDGAGAFYGEYFFFFFQRGFFFLVLFDSEFGVLGAGFRGEEG